MTMKKRFLGLALATAIALPATSVHAAGTTIINGNNTQVLDHNVQVSGSVSNKQGTAPAGKIQVELPTTMAFTVDQSSNFIAPTYTVKNQSSEEIRVAVSEFREGNKNGGITLENLSSFNPANADRSHMGISLNGNVSGVSTSVDLSQVNSNGDDILDVKANGSGVLTLTGVVGNQPSSSSGGGVDVDTNGVQEDFTLVFKIRKK